MKWANTVKRLWPVRYTPSMVILFSAVIYEARFISVFIFNQRVDYIEQFNYLRHPIQRLLQYSLQFN